MGHDLKTIRIEVLYLCGFSTGEIAEEVYGASGKRGPICRIVTQRRLVEARASDHRAARLVEIEHQHPELSGFIAKAARRGQVRATSILLGFSTNTEHRPELISRRRLCEDMARLRDTLPESRLMVPQVRPKSGIIYNTASCSLTWLASMGLMPEWGVQAGVRFRQDSMAAGSSIRSFDYTKPRVDGSAAPGQTDGALDASDRARQAIEAVQFIFRRDASLSQRMGLLDHTVVQDKPLRQFVDMPRAVARQPAAFLVETLEPVACAYRIIMDGEVATRLRDRPGPHAG